MVIFVLYESPQILKIKGGCCLNGSFCSITTQGPKHGLEKKNRRCGFCGCGYLCDIVTYGDESYGHNYRMPVSGRR